MSRTWIVAFDFSELANVALERAAEIMTALGGGRLLVAHVHSNSSGRLGADGVTFRPGFADLDEVFVNEARGNIAAHVDPIAARHPTLDVGVRLERGDAADTLRDLAEREGAEMIVCGSHGRRGIERFLLGSVAERIVRMADMPVMVIKGKALK